MTKDSNVFLPFYSPKTRKKSIPQENDLESIIEENKDRTPIFLRRPSGSEIQVMEVPKDDTENSSKGDGSASRVLEFERWDCVVKKVDSKGVYVYAVDSKKHYTSRFFTFKTQYFENKSLERVENIYEGQRLEWVIKRIKSCLGQERNVEEINVYKRIRKPEWQLKLEVEQQMKELEFLFQE